MKILLVRLSSLGDVLHLFPAVSDLRRVFPEADIHWLVEPAFAELAGWHKDIDKVIPFPLRANKKTWWRLPGLLVRLRKQLKAEQYDMVLDAQGLLKSAILAKLAGAPVYGFAASSARESQAAWFYNKAAKVEEGLHIIEKNRKLIEQLFNTEPKQPLDFGLDQFRQERLSANLPISVKIITGSQYVVMLHGTTWNSKYWPEEYWIELISLLVKQGWYCLLPWGNEDERKRAERLKEAGGISVQVLPKLSLAELVRILLSAGLFVSVESGIGHIAAALEVPGLMVHGPTSPAYSGILGKSCVHLTSGLTCSPCFKRDCPRIEKKLDIPPCQKEINPLLVFEQCLALHEPELNGTST